MSTIAAVCVAAGLAGFVGYIVGALGKPKTVMVTKSNPFDRNGKLAPSVAYAGATQVVAFATTGEYGDTNVPYLRAMKALKRFEDAFDIEPYNEVPFE